MKKLSLLMLVSLQNVWSAIDHRNYSPSGNVKIRLGIDLDERISFCGMMELKKEAKEFLQGREERRNLSNEDIKNAIRANNVKESRLKKRRFF